MPIVGLKKPAEVWEGMRVGRQSTRWEDETENGINALWF